MHKAVFLDRDGTINVDTAYLHKPEDFEFIPGSIEAIKILQDLGYKRIVTTSQSGIGRGYYTEKDMESVNEHMTSELAKEGVTIDGIYFCPHHAEEGIGKYKVECKCRKPMTGLIDEAVAEHDIDLAQSYVIGDKTDDILMGKNAGCRTVLVRTGKGGKDGHFDVQPDYTADNLLEAAKRIKELTS